MIVDDIAIRIKNARKDAKLTQAEVAQRLGITYQAISNYERGVTRIDTDTLLKLCSIYGISINSIVGEGSTMVANILPIPSMRQVPLLGTIACGAPVLAQENIDGSVSMPDHIHADFALRCKGDSMINARIFDGDIVYIRQQDTVNDGEIAAVLIDDEATLKRVRLFPDHIVLEPENPQYRPLSYWGTDAETVRILGKAVAFTSTIL